MSSVASKILQRFVDLFSLSVIMTPISQGRFLLLFVPKGQIAPAWNMSIAVVFIIRSLKEAELFSTYLFFPTAGDALFRVFENSLPEYVLPSLSSYSTWFS